MTAPGDQKADSDDLEALSDALAARRMDSRTPAVVRRAFLSDGALTLRKYLVLEEVESPVLNKQWPWSDAAAMAQAFCTAWEILFSDREMPSPDLLDEGILEMTREVNRGFSTMMEMRMPVIPGSPTQPMRDDGIGWVPRLIEQSYASNIPDPINVPLDRLFVLNAARKFNEGAECVGTDYKDRELIPGIGADHKDHEESQRGAQDDQRADQEELQAVHT